MGQATRMLLDATARVAAAQPSGDGGALGIWTTKARIGVVNTRRVATQRRQGQLEWNSRIAGTSIILSIPLRAPSHTRRTAVVERQRQFDYAPIRLLSGGFLRPLGNLLNCNLRGVAQSRLRPFEASPDMHRHAYACQLDSPK